MHGRNGPQMFNLLRVRRGAGSVKGRLQCGLPLGAVDFLTFGRLRWFGDLEGHAMRTLHFPIAALICLAWDVPSRQRLPPSHPPQSPLPPLRLPPHRPKRLSDICPYWNRWIGRTGRVSSLSRALCCSAARSRAHRPANLAKARSSRSFCTTPRPKPFVSSSRWTVRWKVDAGRAATLEFSGPMAGDLTEESSAACSRPCRSRISTRSPPVASFTSWAIQWEFPAERSRWRSFAMERSTPPASIGFNSTTRR